MNIQIRRKKKNLRRITTFLLASALLLGIVVEVVGQIEWPTRIESFEKYSPVYTEYVETGTAEEELGLPEYLRAVISLDELELDQDTFVQAEPEVDLSDGYTHYDYYYYGYVAPADAEEKYESGELAIYTIYYADEDGSGTVGEVAYRVYGSINGSNNVWFACDEDGDITGVVLDIPVTWSGSYDPDTEGEYTFTASFSDYTYAGSRPTAVITVTDSDSSVEDDSEDEDTSEDTTAEDTSASTLTCTCDVGEDSYSSDHAEDCPYYEEPEEILCTCDLQTNDKGPDHAEDCPMYIAAAEDCACGEDGEAIAADNYPWAHNEDCPWFSPTECMCREEVEETEEQDIDGVTELVTTTVQGDFTHEHDPTNNDCPLYGKDTVTIEKEDETTLSAQLMSTTSVMAVEDAEEIVAYQEETGSALYQSLGMISIVEGSEQSGAIASTLATSSTGMDSYISSNTPTNGNGSYDSEYSGTTIPGTWVDYVNTIWMNKAVNEFEWTDDGDTDAYSNWVWSGNSASSTSGTVTSSATRQPSRSNSGVWEVYSGEQLRYAMENFTSGDTIEIMANINLNGDTYSWSVVSKSTGYSLTLDGNGHTIYNLANYNTSSSSSTYTLFLSGIREGITVRDLTFSTAKMVSANATNYTSIFQFTNNGSSSSTKYATFTNVTVRDSLFYSGEEKGVVSPLGRISATGSATSTGMIPRVSQCYTIGNYIYGTDHVAGFSFGAGSHYYARGGYDESKWGQFTNCYSVDNLLCGTGGHSGGFTSCNGEGAYFESCFTVNEIYGSAAVGGFLGGTTAKATNCYASGKLEGYSVLGGFSFAYVTEASDQATREFTNCYSTVLVGLRTNAQRQGGFSATLVYDNTVTTDYHYEYQTNCYAAGEVGNFDTDMDNPETIGGYLDMETNSGGAAKDVPEDLYTLKNCYYDKQTTAMREWAAGDSQSIDGVTGLLTTELTSSSFNGFSNMSDWVIDEDEQHYPQLAVFANATADDWGSEETAQLVQAYSMVSTSTVFLNDWEEGYTWDEDGVRSETTVQWTGSSGDNAGGELTYDTVRDITSDFTVTSNTTWDHMVSGGAPSQTTNETGNTSVTQETISIDSDTSTGTTESPGMDWYSITATVGSATASRPIRLIAYMAIEAGEDQTIQPGETYDHRDDTVFTMIESLTEDLVVGLDDSEIWSESIAQHWPTDTEGNQVDGYYDIETSATSHTASQGTIVNVEISLAEMDEVNGGVVEYTSADTDGDYYYYEEGEYYIKADLAVNVTGDEADTSITQEKWQGETPLYPDTSTTRQYILSYYWILEDGRYQTDYKIITIEPGDYSVEIEVKNVDGTANFDLLTVDVTPDDEDGDTTYDVTGDTNDHDELDYNDETGDNTVLYTTNVTAAWKKAGEDVVVQAATIELYYRSVDGGTVQELAGSATATGPIEDGTEITIPTIYYYYNAIVVTDDETQREDTRYQVVDVTYTVVEVKDDEGNGTGEYYLRFNKLANAPDNEWSGALGGTNDSSGITPQAGAELEAYINDLQFDVKITLTVTGGAIGGLAWVDADSDGINETGTDGDDEFTPSDSTSGTIATVGDEQVPASAEDLFDLNGLTVTLMHDVDGGWEAVTDTENNRIEIELSDEGGTEKGYSLKSGELEYTVTARAEADWGYYFSGLPAGTYAVKFSTETFPLGAYEASPQDEGDDDTSDSDAIGWYENSDGDIDSEPDDEGYWLSYTMVEDITISSSSGQGYTSYLSLNNDSGLVPRLGSITITKSDDDGKKLSGVTFQLEVLMTSSEEYEEDEDSAVWTTLYIGADDTNETDDNGELAYKDLWPGTYRLTETGSSSGTSLLADAVSITIPYSISNEDSTVEDATAPSYMWDGISYWLDLGYDITNQQVFLLPLSGVADNWYLMIGLIVLTAGGTGIGVSKARRRKRLRRLRKSIGIRIR